MVNVGHCFCVVLFLCVCVFCVCVFVFLCLELFMVCSANDECWAHCFCAAAPITTGIIVRSCFKRCRKELEDEDCATFLAILIQIYLWSEQRDDCKHAHTHTAPQRRKTATKNEMNSCSGRRHLYCLPAENSHGTFFLVQFQWHGIKNTLHTTLKARQKVSLLLRYLTRSICQPSEEGVDSKDRDINRWEVNLSSDRWLVASRVHFLSIPPQTFSSHHLLLTKSSLSGKILLDSGGEENVGQFNEKLDVAISWKFKRTVRKNSWN